MLSEGGIIRDFVELGELNYYRFTLLESAGVKIDAVKFLVTTLSGQTIILASRDDNLNEN